MQAVIAKNERITARISEEVKQLLAQAAELSGATLNQFLVQAALEKAQRMIEQENIIRLSRRNAEWFFNFIGKSPQTQCQVATGCSCSQTRVALSENCYSFNQSTSACHL